MRACVRACVCVRARVCERAHVRALVGACVFSLTGHVRAHVKLCMCLCMHVHVRAGMGGHACAFAGVGQRTCGLCVRACVRAYEFICMYDYNITSKIPARWSGQWFTVVLLVSSPQLEWVARLVHGEDDRE